MTVDIDENFGVTVSQGVRNSTRYVACGSIFNRKTFKNIGSKIQMEGRTYSAAERRVVAEARKIVATMPVLRTI